jgi:hypothetical protein
MSKVQLFSQDERTRGKIITLPLVGDQQFDTADNSISIEFNQVKELLSLDFGIKLIDKSVREDDKNLNTNNDDPNKIMLNGLDDAEIDSFLTPYPAKIIKSLKTRQEKIDYLAKEMAK